MQLIFVCKCSEPCMMLYLYIADEKGIAFCSIGSTIKSFTEVFNRSRQCFYFASMIFCRNYMEVLQGNAGINPEANERLFLLSDDKLAADRCASFKEIYGHLKNLRRNCFYFPMIICCY